MITRRMQPPDDPSRAYANEIALFVCTCVQFKVELGWGQREDGDVFEKNLYIYSDTYLIMNCLHSSSVMLGFQCLSQKAVMYVPPEPPMWKGALTRDPPRGIPHTYVHMYMYIYMFVYGLNGRRRQAGGKFD